MNTTCDTTPVYGSEFFADQSDGSFQSAVEVVPLIMSWIKPSSVIDVGCGVGPWLAAFLKHGASEVIGMDGDYVDRSMLRIPAEQFLPRDLTRPFKVDRSFDLAMSLEVAEHLPESSADQFVASLVNLAPIVLFSAAVPGQGGTHHINEQWPAYWIQKFAALDYEPVDVLRQRLWNNDKIAPCYRQNAFLFLRKGSLGQYPLLAEEAARGPGMPLSMVHPGVFQHALSRPIYIKQLLRAFPYAVSCAIRKRLPIPFTS